MNYNIKNYTSTRLSHVAICKECSEQHQNQSINEALYLMPN